MFWKTREESKELLKSSLSESKNYLEKSFDYLDKCIEIHQSNIENDFSRIFGFTTVKAKNYGHALYSLTLDGLAQEGGAILRNMIEAYELMVYFNLDPTRAQQAIENDLPSAGIIGKKIEGHFKNIREYLNSHGSHFSYSRNSLSHLIDWEAIEFKKFQTVSDQVLKTNIRTLNSILNLQCAEAITSLSIIGYDNSKLGADYNKHHQNFIAFNKKN